MAKQWIITLAGAAGILMLGGCGTMDMQGVSPVDYYAANPIKNKVVYETDSHKVKFARNSTWIERKDFDGMREAMNQRSMTAAQSVVVEFTEHDLNDSARRDAVVKMLRKMGYSKNDISFRPSSSLPKDQLVVNITYAVVITPNCPDWRTSSSTTYSNTWQGNFYCANETNLGLMVADPNDLVRGAGSMPPDTAEKSGRVVQEYRAGRDFRDSASSDGGAGGATTSTESAVESGVAGLGQ